MSAIFHDKHVLFSRISLLYEMSVRGFVDDIVIGRDITEFDRRYIRGCISDESSRRSYYRYHRKAYRGLPDGMSFIVDPWSGWHGDIPMKVLLDSRNLRRLKV